VRSSSGGCNAEEESVDEVKDTNSDMRCITPYLINRPPAPSDNCRESNSSALIQKKSMTSSAQGSVSENT
jgi:hypothetical protein